jgi:CelD/BcsL family acetyltransferase involved in cellulose biosynthesis
MDLMWSARVVLPEKLTLEETHLWREACNRNPVLQSPFFSYAFATAVARARSQVKIGIMEYAGEIAAFLPFQFSNVVTRFLRSAERIGGDMCDHCGIVGLLDFHLSPSEMLKLLGLSAFEFRDWSEDQLRFGLVGQRSTTGLALDLRDGGAAYWHSLKQSNRHFTSEVERGERKLAAKYGPVRFVATVAQNETAAELSRLIHLKGNQYKRTIGKNLFDVSWRRALLSEILDSKDDQCTGVFSALYAGDTWLASHLGIRSKNVLHYWFPVYNVQVARFSPGHILTKYLIGSADENSFSHLDLGGYGDYKRQYRPTTYAMTAGFWVRRSPVGLISHARQSLAWRMASLRSRPILKAD